MYHGIKVKSKAGLPHVIDSPSLSSNTRVKVTLVTKPVLMAPVQVQTGVFMSNMCNASEQYVFILEH
jgi:hypothetical protein